jgi:MFS family permease
VQTAVYLAAPFFTPYMLVQLDLPYFEYMLLLSCGYLGKIMALQWAGQFAKRAGAGRLLVIGGVGIIPLSALWLVSNAMPFLIALQIVGGMAWAAYELAMLLLFFERIPREQRITMLSLYNVGNSAAIVVGALLGAGVMHSLGHDRTAYFAVFLLSSVGRTFALLLIPRHPPQLRVTEAPAGLRTIAVRPMAGGIERPILPAVPTTSAPDATAGTAT